MYVRPRCPQLIAHLSDEPHSARVYVYINCIWKLNLLRAAFNLDKSRTESIITLYVTLSLLRDEKWSVTARW